MKVRYSQRMNQTTAQIMNFKKRFRGFLPIVVDVETGGFNPATDALLELAAITLSMDDQGILRQHESHHFHIKPFPGANMEADALEFTGIDPDHPFRLAIDEKEALEQLFESIRRELKSHHCQRAILVGHNPAFDRSFLLAATERNRIKNDPFHRFSTLDTATLSALAFRQTVLAKALQAAKLSYDPKQAHGALYDAERTAELFCNIFNRWQQYTKPSQ